MVLAIQTHTIIQRKKTPRGSLGLVSCDGGGEGYKEERRYHAATVELTGMDLANKKLQKKHLVFDDENLATFMHPGWPV